MKRPLDGFPSPSRHRKKEAMQASPRSRHAGTSKLPHGRFLILFIPARWPANINCVASGLILTDCRDTEPMPAVRRRSPPTPHGLKLGRVPRARWAAGQRRAALNANAPPFPPGEEACDACTAQAAAAPKNKKALRFPVGKRTAWNQRQGLSYLAALAALMASISMGVTLNRSPVMP